MLRNPTLLINHVIFSQFINFMLQTIENLRNLSFYLVLYFCVHKVKEIIEQGSYAYFNVLFEETKI